MLRGHWTGSTPENILIKGCGCQHEPIGPVAAWAAWAAWAARSCSAQSGSLLEVPDKTSNVSNMVWLFSTITETGTTARQFICSSCSVSPSPPPAPLSSHIQPVISGKQRPIRPMCDKDPCAPCQSRHAGGEEGGGRPFVHGRHRRPLGKSPTGQTCVRLIATVQSREAVKPLGTRLLDWDVGNYIPGPLDAAATFVLCTVPRCNAVMKKYESAIYDAMSMYRSTMPRYTFATGIACTQYLQYVHPT